MTFDGTCERGGVQRAPQEIEERSPAPQYDGAMRPSSGLGQ
jgi:hypothetical protein